MCTLKDADLELDFMSLRKLVQQNSFLSKRTAAHLLLVLHFKVRVTLLY